MRIEVLVAILVTSIPITASAVQEQDAALHEMT